jgi:tetratricopeptide (TPR) repeat protein
MRSTATPLYIQPAQLVIIREQKLRKLVVSFSIPLVAALTLLMEPAVADSPFSVSVPGEGGFSRPTLSTASDYYIRANNESACKDYAHAVEDFNEALRLKPSYGEALGNRGAARFNLQDYSGALADYNAALKIFPNTKALLDLKAQVEGVMREQANQVSQSAQINQVRPAVIPGGDFADPSTMIMMDAQRRGLVPAYGDLSDPATIIMMNAKRRGLIPQNTPNP